MIPMKNLLKIQLLILFVLGVAGLCTNVMAQQKPSPQFNKMMAESFRSEGIASVDRITQDATQKFCSDPQFVSTVAGAIKAQELQRLNMATISPPSDGSYLGDWKSGEAIAQSGRGGTWTDTANTTNGGGCYNCHEIDKKEISHGNIGPSLWNYGKIRGNSQEILTYTWNRINNSKAYNACSNMPRFGHFKILNEKQIQDLMALLIDPQSPVNQ